MLGGRISTYDFWGDTNIQSIAVILTILPIYNKSSQLEDLFFHVEIKPQTLQMVGLISYKALFASFIVQPWLYYRISWGALKTRDAHQLQLN